MSKLNDISCQQNVKQHSFFTQQVGMKIGTIISLDNFASFVKIGDVYILDLLIE